MVIDNFNSIHKDKNILVTGHTGFKGSWLTMWLHKLNANVTGLSLNPEGEFSHWKDIKLKNINSHIGDIKDFKTVKDILLKTDPEIIFHLAAQPLVKRSYEFPIETWQTNVIGTINLLEASRQLKNLKSIIIITSDKCYENLETNIPFKETDRIGGFDPYSSSKAAVEILVKSYQKSFFDNKGPSIATARAGNVIGGGDWSDDRLIPDLIRSLMNRREILIRYPNATRPWQHVLDCLYGYLKLSEMMLNKKRYYGAFNFGPDFSSNKSVEDILIRMKNYWPNISWKTQKNAMNYESELLSLNSDKARTELNWKPILNLNNSIKLTIEWYKEFNKNNIISFKQLSEYTHLLSEKNEN